MKYTFCFVLAVLFIALTIISALYAQDSHQWHLPEGAKMRFGKGAINKVASAPDGTRLAIGSSIGVWIYDIETSKALDLFPMYGVSCLAFSPDGKTFACLCKGESDAVHLWETATGKYIQRLLLTGREENSIESIAFSPDGRTLAIGWGAGGISWLDTKTEALSQHFDMQHRWGVLSLAFSPDGALLASCGEDSTVRLWDLKTGKHARILIGHNDRVLNVAFSPDGKTLASSSVDGTVLLWDLTSDNVD